MIYTGKGCFIPRSILHNRVLFTLCYICDSLDAPVAPLALKVPVRTVSVTKECSHILVGLENGKLIVVGAGKPEEVRRTSSICELRKWGASVCLYASSGVCVVGEE